MNPVPMRTCFPHAVAVLLFAAAGLAAWQVHDVLQPARAETTILFNHGLDPVVTAAPASWTNAWCGSCHKQEYAQWQESRHSVAGTSDTFVVECLEPGSGRQQFCLNCHTPRIPDRGLPTAEPPGLDDAFGDQPDWLTGGVDCLTCHVRDGVVVATRVTSRGLAKHPMREDFRLGRTEFCAGCHQFAFKDSDLPDRFHGALQQASLEEFREYKAGGGKAARCHECHMPKGGHLMPGGFSDEMVRQAVGLELDARWIDPGREAEVAVTLRTGRVGHRVPGGEELRFLTARTEVYDAGGRMVGRPVSSDKTHEPLEGWPAVETLRRLMGDREHGRDLQAAPAPDTRLRSGEIRRYSYRVHFDPESLRGSLTVRTRLWYHLMHDGKAELFGHQAEDVQRVVRETEVRLDLPRPAPTDR